MKARSLRALALFASLAVTAGSALGNGRFPRAQHLVEEPGHPERLTIGATYGLLVTDDRGKNWSYVCDAAFTFQPMFASDAVLGFTVSGLLLGVQNAMTLSRDRGCDFGKVFEPSGFTSIDDFTVSPSLKDVLALATTFENGKNIIRLQESEDGGQNWHVIGTPLPAALAYTLDVDPRNPARIYVTGSNLTADATDPGLFLTSLDRGTTWTVGTIPNTNIDASPWIAAVHPTDGNKIFVRTDSWKRNASSQDLAGDALLYSGDGGKTWTELLRAGGSDPEVPGGKLLGFALSPDGSTVLAGYGDIADPLRVVDPDGNWLGVYKSSSDGSYSFGAGAPAAPVPLLKVPTTCLAWTNEGVYGCFAPKGEPHTLAFSKDANLAPASLTTLMKSNEVLGAPRCCNGRSVTACAWSTDCQALGACDAGAPAPDASGGTCSDAGGGGGSSADASSTGGAGGSAGGTGGSAGSAGGGPGGTGGSASGSNDGCGCRIMKTRVSPPVGEMVWLFAALGAWVRRRRRSRYFKSQPNSSRLVVARPTSAMESTSGISLGQTSTQFCALPQSSTPPLPITDSRRSPACMAPEGWAL
jgi:hypothetical protein